MQTNKVSKSEFKTKALELFRLVESSGQSLIVTDHGKPTVEVKPYKSQERLPLEILRGSITFYDSPLEPVASDEWEAAR